MFERYYRELLNFLALKVSNRQQAADLTQESYLRVYAARHAGMAIRDPRALLYKTARNLLTDDYRRSQARAAPSPAPATDEEGGDSVEADQHAAPQACEPEHALAARQRFEAIAAIVDGLPPRCREAFLLVKFDGLTHAQTAARMGIAVKTVEMHVQIALNACWDRLGTLDAADGAPAAHPARPRKAAARPSRPPSEPA